VKEKTTVTLIGREVPLPFCFLSEGYIKADVSTNTRKVLNHVKHEGRRKTIYPNSFVIGDLAP